MEADDARIIPINIEEEMKSSYIDYSMSVIVSRALPDARDGLKPVHRRVLYGMNELSLTHNSAHKKSARIVGEVLGKYHPHGDAAVYDTMVRMAQPWSMRYPLVDGQGNFGSVDGDSPAAMRYTEARMTQPAEEMLADLGKETVDFRDNFDGALQEPVVLPSALPNLLLNGGDGIAVGMATKLPPHNLNEVVDATIAYIEDNDISIDGLIEHLPGPDFPTGGIIHGHSGVREAYKTGRGRVIMRAKMHEEELREGRLALIITEIPFQVNKSSLIEKIAHAVRDGKIEGISHLRDESDREGMRIVVELKRDAVPLVVQNKLYKYSYCQRTFGVNMVALVNGRPKVLTLKDAIRHYVNHRHEVVVRRTEYDLRKAERRAHILEGLTRALDHIDAVIAIIRHSDDTEAARTNLMSGRYPETLRPEELREMGLPEEHPAELDSAREAPAELLTDGEEHPAQIDQTEQWLTERQAQAILDLRLNRLTGLEREKIQDEYRDIIETIEDLRGILASEERRYQIIKDELRELKEKYGDERRTEIDYSASGDINIEDLIEDEQVAVTVTHQGLMKRTPADVYRQQGRGGVGVKGTGKREDDYIEHLFVCSNHDWLLFFTDHGQCYWLRVYDIPEGRRTSKGRSIRNLIQIAPDDTLRAVLAISKEDFEDEAFLQNHYVTMATRQGQVKKTRLEAFSRPRVDGIIAIDIVEGDQLLEATLTSGDDNVILASSSGHAVRFHEEDVRPTGRNTRGVRGIRLPDDEETIGMIVDQNEKQCVLSVSANGYGKRTTLEAYPTQGRGGKGVITLKRTKRTGRLVAIKGVADGDDLMIITENGIMIRTSVDEVSTMGRNTQGVRLINLKDGDGIADVTRLVVEEGEEEEPAEPAETA